MFIDSSQKVDRALDRWIKEILDGVYDVEVIGRSGVDDELEGWRGSNRLCGSVNMVLKEISNVTGGRMTDVAVTGSPYYPLTLSKAPSWAISLTIT